MKISEKIFLGLTTVAMVGCGIAALVVTSKVAAVALLAFAAIALITLVGFGIKKLLNNWCWRTVVVTGEKIVWIDNMTNNNVNKTPTNTNTENPKNIENPKNTENPKNPKNPPVLTQFAAACKNLIPKFSSDTKILHGHDKSGKTYNQHEKNQEN